MTGWWVRLGLRKILRAGERKSPQSIARARRQADKAADSPPRTRADRHRGVSTIAGDLHEECRGSAGDDQSNRARVSRRTRERLNGLEERTGARLAGKCTRTPKGALDRLGTWFVNPEGISGGVRSRAERTVTGRFGVLCHTAPASEADR
ncbi:hypothetical protein CPLU01_04537 [Colletotrichum plurivorum]|uniref:Uncharacterized protein n=1 Tax=Colletotrichum plurivorum TaxID=2175906 RepID=A0A8H6KNX4_9PEZI|nr:hypothetical protein CPLU01_04537 [Colletotrichum plurivorum]